MGFFSSFVQAATNPANLLNPYAIQASGAANNPNIKAAASSPTSYLSPYMAQMNLLNGGGGQQQAPALGGSNAAAREADLNAGFAKGHDIFYDQDMNNARARLDDQSKGYNGQELGAMREQARGEIQGERSKDLRELAGKAARGGIGGARSAAMQASADKGFQQNRAEMERKMTLDNANLVRSGTKDANDFMMRQKYGELGTGTGYAQLGVDDRAADSAAAAAAQQPKKGIVGQFLDGIL